MMGRNAFFRFKQFEIGQDQCAMKVTTDACLFGAWCGKEVEQHNPKNVLDIGTGTGLLSLMLAQNTAAQITAVELDAAAAAQAADNFKQSDFADRLQVVHADVQEFNAERFDVIVSNPPFYEQQLQSPLQNRNAAMHSTSLTMENLLFVTDRLLHPCGEVFLLLPFYRKDELFAALNAVKLFPSKLVAVRPVPDKPPFRIMVSASREKESLAEEQLIIQQNNGDYTAAFVQLLQPYYLYL